MKRCNRCNTLKPLDAFYGNPGMPDKHLKQCKECTKKAHAKYRAEHRAACNATVRNWVTSEKGRAWYAERRVRDREKVAAQHKLQGAVDRGKVIRQPCEICGDSDTHGHHDDYRRPFDVRWLCRTHHVQRHVALAAERRRVAYWSGAAYFQEAV